MDYDVVDVHYILLKIHFHFSNEFSNKFQKHIKKKYIKPYAKKIKRIFEDVKDAI